MDRNHEDTQSQSSDASDDSNWLDVEPDIESLDFVSLFDDRHFATLQEMLDHCKTRHSFDLQATMARLHLDFLGTVKLVNFIRSASQKNQTLPERISLSDFNDENYLKPILENDAVLFSLDDLLESAGDSSPAVNADQTGTKESLQRHNKGLEEELESIRQAFASYRLAVEQTLDRRWGSDQDPVPTPSKKSDPSGSYFESYANNDIHETMLKDAVRTDAYRDFIYENKQAFKDKVVLDIGCGTGILSMFCAKAGAAKVIAVDKSDIIDKARENVFNNGLSDTITCLRGAIEDVVLPVDKVDIIVSEWMGYCLLYEAMLPSVLYARDKYLKADGLLVPNAATIWIAPVEDQTYVADNISFWRDVYGFDMKAMQAGITEEVRVEIMPKTSLCGEPHPFKILDLYTTSAKDLVFTAGWQSKLTRNVPSVDGFLIWFDNFFSPKRDEALPDETTTPTSWVSRSNGNIAFTTGPFGQDTHWKQGLLMTARRNQGGGAQAQLISGDVEFAAADDNPRALVVRMNWAAEQNKCSQSWSLK